MQVAVYQPGDQGAVRAFLAAQYPESPQKADERFFEWRFARHPLGSSLPDYLLAWEQGRLIGQMGALRDRLSVNGQWRDCLWLVDLIVTPEHRGGLAALRLFQAAMKRCPLLLAVGAGPNLLPLYQALGWRLLPVAGTYFSIGRLSGLLRLAEESEQPRSRWNGALRLTDPGFALAQTVGGLGPRGVEIQEAGAIGESVDALIEELTPGLGITTYRSAAMLRWKFCERPVGRHFLLEAYRGGRLRGYLAVKRMRRGGVSWGEIADLLTPPEEPAVFRALVAAAVRRCRALDADFVRLRCAHPAHTRQLRQPFWIRRNRAVIDDLLVYSRDGALREALLGSPWHLTSVVSDRADHGRDEWT